MSTPSSRRSAHSVTHSPIDPPRLNSQSPHTPSSERNFSPAEPKSDLLRSVLEARRAKDAPLTPGTDPMPLRRPATSSNATPTPAARPPSDPWLDAAALSDDDVPLPPRRHRRRPSEGGGLGQHRLPTQREQQAELETLKTKLFNLNLQSELLKKQNGELKDKLDMANQRIEELEPLEGENADLRRVNEKLKKRVRDMQDRMHELEASNEEILEIQTEAVGNMEGLQAGIEEAADTIIRLEEEKDAFQREIAALKQQLEHARKDGGDRGAVPARIYSIDESSSPSTAHFDSDYYSQPESPQVKGKNSKEGLSFADRAARLSAAKLLDVNVRSKQSMQSMKKRLSDASLKNTRLSLVIPTEADIPESPISTARPATPVPNRRQRVPEQQQRPRNASTASSIRSTSSPRTPSVGTTAAPDGLRGIYREHRATKAQQHASSGLRRSSSSNSSTPSRHAHPSSKSPSPSILSETASIATSSALSIPPPPSILSEDTLPVPDKEKWWRDVRGVRTIAPQTGSGTGTRRNSPTPAQMQTQRLRSLHVGASPDQGRHVEETNFLFNPAEDEEEFLEKARGYGGRGGVR
ncbi:uncharacterized protein EI97DRAFT_462694 [Westerdykella ornata]|uniref:Centrosomin N-terminal motif 1 domain-containing protein n=1 Tax=Westerdykella ornata TaxID=318751 RepID=A0A6A6J611_WESOR|nr:uncharacterized protein EI97DRAFT_462694 [Westerdykella ornata]KAF2271573.1 hypothetical protein EI97DRAFT_462694 [Westerdykella ornata]